MQLVNINYKLINMTLNFNCFLITHDLLVACFVSLLLPATNFMKIDGFLGEF